VPEQQESTERALSNDALLAVAREAADAAAAVIRDAAPGVRNVVWREKGATDFVSAVDVAAEESILSVIRRRVPGAGVLAEESAAVMTAERQATGIVFVVDPLDGTTNFLHGYPEYAVSVGVLRDGMLAAGVVIDVPLNEVFTATAGGGAFRHADRIQVSEIENPHRAPVGTGYPFTRREAIAPYLVQLGRVMAAAGGVRRAGAAALDLVSVACGRFEGFWETRLSPWDIAAGLLIVREAGGIVTTIDGKECPVAKTSIVAGSALMHRWLLGLLNDPPT
jgi:myo-inositol-1(or 4)-monophosphatase